MSEGKARWNQSVTLVRPTNCLYLRNELTKRKEEDVRSYNHTKNQGGYMVRVNRIATVLLASITGATFTVPTFADRVVEEVVVTARKKEMKRCRTFQSPSHPLVANSSIISKLTNLPKLQRVFQISMFKLAALALAEP